MKIHGDHTQDLVQRTVGPENVVAAGYAAEPWIILCDPNQPGLKVLFITGYADVAVTGSTILEPRTYLLTKPFAIDALAARVTSIITAG